MTYQRFRSLMYDALECADYDQYLAECGGSVDDPLRVLPFVWAYSHSPECRTIRAETGLSQAKFADAYGIAQRSVENWESDSETAGHRAPAATLSMLAFAVLCDLLGEV